MSEQARSNSAAQKISHECCAAVLCTKRQDNIKDLTFLAFLEDSLRRMEWEVKTKRSERKFKLNKSLFWCSKHFVSTDYKHSLTGKGKDLLPTASPSRFQWTKVSSHEIKRAKQCKRREARLAIAYSVVLCSEDNGDPLKPAK